MPLIPAQRLCSIGAAARTVLVSVPPPTLSLALRLLETGGWQVGSVTKLGATSWAVTLRSED